VLSREHAFVPGLLQLQIQIKELDDGVVLRQTFTILGEYGVHLHSIVYGQANEPAKQKAVLGLLYELALGMDAVELLQQHGGQELLGRDAGTPALDVGLIHAWKNASIFTKATLTISRIARSGWSAGTKIASFRAVNRLSVKVSAPQHEVSSVCISKPVPS
jgi:hypothetical protein